MRFTLRVDLDYVPWDSPDATEFGHGEPAMILRLLDLAEQVGGRWHFFASNRVLRAFSDSIGGLSAQGHALDWYCKHPEQWSTRASDAVVLFQEIGIMPVGLATKSAWPSDLPDIEPRHTFQYLSAPPGPAPFKVFPVTAPSDRDAYRSGHSAVLWSSELKSILRSAAARGQDAVFSVRPQVLAKFDPHLDEVRALALLAKGLDFHIDCLPWRTDEKPLTDH